LRRKKEKGKNMRKTFICSLITLLSIAGMVILWDQVRGAEIKREYLLPGDVKEGWKVFTVKRCSACHAIWGEGGKGGPDLGSLPENYTTPAELAALMWNHGPEMWGKLSSRKIPYLKIERKEMADLFAFLYFTRYMDEPGSPQKGGKLVETKGCGKCHTIKEGVKEDLSRWAMYGNPIVWAQMMWNHGPQMERELKKKGLSWVQFKEKEMVDLIAFLRSINANVERVYLSPGDPNSGEKLFNQKGCIQCHKSESKLDLSKKKEFPPTIGQFAGMMWNHSHEMWKGMEEKGIERPVLSAQEMADMVAYLFATRYFDPPGSVDEGKTVFIKKQCNFCHTKGGRAGTLSGLRGRVSPIFMAQTMWNHGSEMFEKMNKAKIPWQKIDGREMVNLMEYINRGAP
jgi:cytochrome c2